MNNNKKTVFVGVSGGVDSSVSAALLKEQGYNVVGVFIRTWTPDFIECTWRDERRDAMRVCAHLDIPFLECDAEKEYKEGVADYMIKEYEKGKTPNPDVMCNREVKFGVFWNFAKSHGAQFIATGHYAVNETSEIINSFREATGGGVPSRGNPRDGVKELREKLFIMKQSPDKGKDQSYFLWTLTQDDLSHTLFPIGHLKKTQVRKLAKKYKLPTAIKKDSQGVCFLGPLDMKDFLKHYIKPKKGEVLLARQSPGDGGNEKGDIIGTHDGAIFFTLGERHGFTIFNKTENDGPYYVVKKDIKENTIIVSHRPEEKSEDNTNECILQRTNWISYIPKEDRDYKSEIRYHGEYINCRLNHLNEDKTKIIFDKNVLVDSGQSVVIYDGDICLGGGIVE